MIPVFVFAILLSPAIPVIEQGGLAKKILDLDAKWSARAAAHDLDGVMSYYSKEAVLLAPNEPIASTSKEIRAAWAPFCAKTTSIGWKATKIEVAKAGDIAYMYGTYKLSFKGTAGKTIKDSGKFLEVWKKQHDGGWKCTADMFNSDLPMG